MHINFFTTNKLCWLIPDKDIFSPTTTGCTAAANNPKTKVSFPYNITI